MPLVSGIDQPWAGTWLAWHHPRSKSDNAAGARAGRHVRRSYLPPTAIDDIRSVGGGSVLDARHAATPTTTGLGITTLAVAMARCWRCWKRAMRLIGSCYGRWRMCQRRNVPLFDDLQTFHRAGATMLARWPWPGCPALRDRTAPASSAHPFLCSRWRQFLQLRTRMEIHPPRLQHEIHGGAMLRVGCCTS